ncbi:TetR family transcriptional regulator [Corynebacterium sp. HMSC08A12]|uniref:TetR/AcrR family transcriptional regulator n=1 Tax=Corynebacterium sp. HMSC08A12 TaxID=1581134 RepID=UPI0008A14B16|nr:helix-turn-helix domain-containing protein [Corynebacterium sp. HMSC08A12]OFT34898.1 TetR family transcriptional regulator [Corynebacterium sp. HMSC08A12]
MGLRERKRLETRLRIEDEATRLFLDRSFDGVTLEEICEAADISRRTFFNYFSSKEHVAVGKQPPLLTKDDFNKLESFSPARGSLPQYLYAMLTKKRIEEAKKSDNANLDPELAESIRWRRSQIIKRFPSLALAKLASYEKLRSDLAEAVCKNLEGHPGNRSTDMEAMEEAHLIVTAATTVQWAAATSATRRGRTLNSTKDFDVALTGLRQVFSAIEPATLKPSTDSTAENISQKAQKSKENRP